MQRTGGGDQCEAGDCRQLAARQQQHAEQCDAERNTGFDVGAGARLHADEGTGQQREQEEGRAGQALCGGQHGGRPDADGDHRQQVIGTGEGMRQTGRKPVCAVAFMRLCDTGCQRQGGRDGGAANEGRIHVSS